MAVDLSKLVSKRRLAFEELNNKLIAIDAYNTLYQFLSIIRQPDGTPLMDSRGNVTSHLSGIFYRTIEILDYGARPIFVFDGIPSILKQKTIEARMQRRKEAQDAYMRAKEAGDLEAARSHAMASTRVDRYIVESSKTLLEYMGIPFINAPSEGEAQASFMCKHGLVSATVSQDYDTLLFGSTKVVRNLTFSGRRKLPKKNVFVNVEPEIVDLKETLNTLGINQKQLIWIGILLGTDFNDGIKGVGPKTALKMVKDAKNLEDIKRAVKEKFDTEFEIDPREIEELFTNPEVKDIQQKQLSEMLEKSYSSEKILKFMCDEHGFSHERIEKFVERLAERRNETRQKSIGKWFK